MDRAKFNHETTAEQVLESIDLTGKRVLITGGSSGLGTEAARVMATKGAEVIITARNLEKGEKVVESIKATTQNEKVFVEWLELASFTSIREFAQKFGQKYKTFHILINNAGVMACPYAETVDGFELQFGTNHLGHFLLTGLLVPYLTTGARIVNLSSSGHKLSPIVFDDILHKTRIYEKWTAYGQSKTANALHVVGLEKRLAGKGIHAFAVHPGAIMTELARHMDKADEEMMMGRLEAGAFRFKSVEAGAATEVYAATAPELEGKGGLYLADCQVQVIDNESDTEQGVFSYALDMELADRLWEESEKMVGQRFSF